MAAAWYFSDRTSGRFLTPVVVAETGSTNADLAERARSGAPAGEVLIAEHQTAGRGRQGRTWFDRPGSSLLMSWTIDVAAEVAPLVPLVAGTAMVEAVRGVVGRDAATLKWPNDVLSLDPDGRKLTGILAEAVSPAPEPRTLSGNSAEAVSPAPEPRTLSGNSAEAATPAADHAVSVLRVIVGMGTNIDLGLDGQEVPAEVRDRAVDLRNLAGRSISPSEMVDAVLDSCERELHVLEQSQPEALDRYRARCSTIGRSVRFETADGIVEGVASGVADTGALVLATPSGAVHLTAGDAHHL